MSFLDEEQQDLVLGLTVGHVDKEEFARRFPIRLEELPDLGLRLLQQSLEQKDAKGVDAGLTLAYHFGLSDRYLDVLMKLAGADWHETHEDVIGGLDKLLAPESVGVLHQAALAEYPYLREELVFPVRRKCVWALGKIGTPEAVGALADLSHAQDPELAEAAAKQLARLSQVHTSGPVGEAVRAALASAPKDPPSR